MRLPLALITLIVLLMPGAGPAHAAPGVNPAPSAKAWAAIAARPDWSGVWLPDVIDQAMQIKTNPPPWTDAAGRKAAALAAQETEGRPKGLAKPEVRRSPC